MTTQDGSVLDAFLTQHSNMLLNTDDMFIAEKILPAVPVGPTTGKIAGYGSEHLRIMNTVHRGKGEYLEVDTQVYSSQDYEIVDHGLKEIVTENQQRNAITPYNALLDVTMALSSIQQLAKERALAVSLTDPAIITQGVTLSGNSQYDNLDHADSNPIEDGILAKATIKDASGKIPNVAIMNWEVAENLRFHDQFVHFLGWREMRPGGLSNQELAFALGVQQVLIGKATYNSAKRGQTDVFANVWGNDLIYAYVSPNLQLRDKTLGVEVRKSGTSPRQIYRKPNDEPINSTKITCLDNYDQLILNATCAYLIQDVIA